MDSVVEAGAKDVVEDGAVVVAVVAEQDLEGVVEAEGTTLINSHHHSMAVTVVVLRRLMVVPIKVPTLPLYPKKERCLKREVAQKPLLVRRLGWIVLLPVWLRTVSPIR